MIRWLVVASIACRGGPAPLPDAPDDPGVSPTCTGDCQTTRLSATFQTTRLLDHAVFGMSADSTLHVEAYRGGDVGCPTETSATPDYSLVLGKVAPPTGTAATSSPGNLL